jgi:alpha-beta hydrolase superfamily lysophospholipase
MGFNTKTGKLFPSQAFHYQALRTMGHSSAFGANPGECLAAIRSIRSEDAESWYQEWHGVGVNCEKAAGSTCDRISKGKALMRASNYFRTSEFFLPPGDSRRLLVYRESVDAFTGALAVLHIPHKVWTIPYERVSMRAYFFPGEEAKPLILACGGYDSTNEELFFWIAEAARERGYPCVIFEGPGQSNMIREYDIRFTHEWEKPVAALLDFMNYEEPEILKRKKILLGTSMGTMLALRAAAFEKRIDAVVGFGGFFDMKGSAWAQLPFIAKWIHSLGLKGLFNRLARFKASKDIGRRWALNNGCWTIGADTPYDLLEKIGQFTLKPCADRITCDVMILSGEKDHLIPESDARQFKLNIKNARSYCEHIFLDADGAGEQCQAGAIEQMHRVFFDWIEGLSVPGALGCQFR